MGQNVYVLYILEGGKNMTPICRYNPENNKIEWKSGYENTETREIINIIRKHWKDENNTTDLHIIKTYSTDASDKLADYQIELGNKNPCHKVIGEASCESWRLARYTRRSDRRCFSFLVTVLTGMIRFENLKDMYIDREMTGAQDGLNKIQCPGVQQRKQKEISTKRLSQRDSSSHSSSRKTEMTEEEWSKGESPFLEKEK